MSSIDAATKFIALAEQEIHRDGIKRIINYLANETDFFSAPASTRFHGAHTGGLVKHSINVHNALLGFSDHIFDASLESIAIVSLFHDVCKANMYKASTRNVKNEKTGAWEKKPFYNIDEEFPYGHGEKSVFIISKFMQLTDEEAMAINWHMGGFDTRVIGGSFACGQAFEKYPLAMYTHFADMVATHEDEVEDRDQ